MKKDEKRIVEVEKMYRDCLSDLGILKKFNKDIVSIEKRIKKLEKYYKQEWIDDIGIKTDNYYESMSQDGIYNVIEEQYMEKIKILKRIVSGF